MDNYQLIAVLTAIIVSVGFLSGESQAQRAQSPDSIAGSGRILIDLSTPSEGQTVDKQNRDETQSAYNAAITELREQVGAASGPKEKFRLQFKLVDRLITAGLKDQAAAELKAMAAENHFDPQGFYNVGNALARLDQSHEAVKAYRKAIEQRKGKYSRALNNLGVMLLRIGEWDEAFDVFVRALRIENFHYAEASYNLGRLYAARGETDMAIREWRRALRINPEHSDSAEAIAGARRGSITVASRSAAPRRESSGNRPRKVEERSASLSKSPSRSDLSFAVDPETYQFLQRARIARDRGRNDEAIKNYQRVISRMGGYFAPANLELSFTLINLKKNDEALNSLLPLADKDGAEFPISHYHIGRIYESKGELNLAEERYSKAASFFSDVNAQFLLDVSRVREKLGNLTGALNAMEQYVEAMERQGLKPDWSEERLAQLRQLIRSSQ